MADVWPLKMTDAVDRACNRANRWVRECAEATVGNPPHRLQALLADEQGRAFGVNLVDSLLRSDSLTVAASSLRKVAQNVPQDLPWYVRSLVRTSGAVAPVLPAPVVPLAKSVLRNLIGSLVVDARPKKLGVALEAMSATGARPELALASVAAIGETSASAHRDRLTVLMQRSDVTALTYRLGAAVHIGDPWNFDDTIERAAAAVAPLYESAHATETRLVMEVRERRELDLALAVLTTVLERPELDHVDAGISLPAALADSFATVQQLTAWAQVRVEGGGTKLLIRLTDDVTASTEREDCILNGWPHPSLVARTDTLAALVRGLHWLCADEHRDGVIVSIATHDPFVLAYAREYSGEDVSCELVLMAGVAPEWERITAQDDATLSVTAIAVDAAEADSLAPVITERIVTLAAALADAEAESARSDEDRDAAGREIVRKAGDDPALSRHTLDRSVAPAQPSEQPLLRAGASESGDLTQAVLGIAQSAQSSLTSPLPREVEGLLFGGTPFVETAVFSDIESDELAYGAPGFRNAQVTDPHLDANREWARATHAAEPIADDYPWRQAADEIIEMRHGEGSWEALAATERAIVLERAAYEIALRRARLITTARHQRTTFTDADRDVTTLIDYANYYAATVRELDTVAGAVFVAPGVTVVESEGADLIAAAGEAALAVLATGGAVVLLARDDEKASIAVIAEALWAAGVPEDALRIAEGSAMSAATASTIDNIVMTGTARSVDTALAVVPPVAVNARVRGVNTVIVTPSADPHECARSLVTSAFARGGRAFESTGLAILVGSISRSSRLAKALIDATPSTAEDAFEIDFELDDDALWALTELEVGQSWLVEPRKVGENRFTPGIRVGVEPGSRFASARFEAPVLGILHAPSLAAAIVMANDVSCGAVAGLETSDDGDAARWLRGIQAGSLFIGRPVTDAVVQRQPSGGWLESAAGTAAKAGGPNRLMTLGTWRPTGGRGSSATLHLRGLDSRVTTLVEAAQPDLDYESFDWVRRAALSDALAWDREFGHVRDVTKLGIERNLFRYRPVTTALRATAQTPLRIIVRVILAAVRAQADFTVSIAEGMPAGFRRALGEADITTFVETDAEFVARALATNLSRVRIVGADAGDVAATIRAESTRSIAVHSSPATTAGRVELLAFLREQTVSIRGRAVAACADVI